MIIKSMSRKHPSFDQIIDYMESERKLKSRRFSIYRNTYSQNSEQLKNEFTENSRHLKFRKNGVYLYHEVISIKRAQHISEDQQKEILQNIVSEYLKVRAKNNLAYAVLHEDKNDNLHYHIVISANEAENSTRKRLSKIDFAEIQTRLEKWVLETYPELEQKAVFTQNLTDQEKRERERKAHISNRGAELKRRTGKTATRDQVKTTLENIFENARDGRNFTELLEKYHLKIYQRGKQYGVIDQEGIKYRFSSLGLTEEWEALDSRMMEKLQPRKIPEGTNEKTQSTVHDTQETQQREKSSKLEQTVHTRTQAGTFKNTEQTKENRMNPNPIEAVKEVFTQPPKLDEENTVEEETQRRLEEMEQIRKAKASNQSSTSHKNQSS